MTPVRRYCSPWNAPPAVHRLAQRGSPSVYLVTTMSWSRRQIAALVAGRTLTAVPAPRLWDHPAQAAVALLTCAAASAGAWAYGAG